MSHYVYRAFDGFGSLLYVGEAKDIIVRFNNHFYEESKRAIWAGEAKKFQHTEVVTTKLARAFEQTLIKYHSPIYNVRQYPNARNYLQEIDNCKWITQINDQDYETATPYNPPFLNPWMILNNFCTHESLAMFIIWRLSCHKASEQGLDMNEIDFAKFCEVPFSFDRPVINMYRSTLPKKFTQKFIFYGFSKLISKGLIYRAYGHNLFYIDPVVLDATQHPDEYI